MAISCRCALLIGALISASPFAPAADAAPQDPTYAALRAARPDGRRLEVHNLRLERDVFRFRFEHGTFHFLTPVAGETVSAIFRGEGSFQLLPATENERRHLGMLLNEEGFEVLADRFTELVLQFADGTFAELEAAGDIVQREPDPKALAAFAKSMKRQKTKFRTNFQLRLLRLVGAQSQELDFPIRLPKKPRRVLINAHHDVLARDG